MTLTIVFFSVYITSLDSCLEGVESSCPAAPGGGGGARSGGEDLSYTYLDPHKKLKVKQQVLAKVSRLCQLLSYSRGFLSIGYDFEIHRA